MFCSKCGTELPDDSKFCSKCGNDLSEVAPSISGNTIRKKNRFLVLLISVLAGFAVILIVIVVVFLINRWYHSQETTERTSRQSAKREESTKSKEYSEEEVASGRRAEPGKMPPPVEIGLDLTGKTLKIGAVFAITGPASSLGIPEMNTARMLEEQINAAGGINGGNLEIIIYDTAGDEATALTRVDRLLNADNVIAVVGPSQSGTSLAILDLIEDAEVPLVSCAASVKIVEPVSERKWVFKTPQSDFLMVQAIADYLKKKGISRVAIMTVSNPFGASGKEQLESILPEAGISIVAKEEFSDKATSTKVQLTKIGGTDAQAVICWSVSPAGATVTRNMKEDLKMAIPLIMSHGVANKAYIDLAGEAANGVIFPFGKLLVADDLPDDDPQKKALQKYAADYRAMFNEEPNTFGGHAWDAINLIVEAMKKVGDDPAKIRDAIESTTNFVGTGGIFNFAPFDHNGLTKQGVIMVKIVNGRWTLAL